MEWDSFLIHWGGPFYLVDVVKRADVQNLSACTIGAGDTVAPATGSEAFYRYPKGSAPSIHNGFTDGTKLYATIEKLGYPFEHRSQYYDSDHFNFAPVAAPNTLENASGSFDATEIDLSKIFTTTKSSFSYDEETGTYKKYLYGSPQIDELTGDQLTFETLSSRIPTGNTVPTTNTWYSRYMTADVPVTTSPRAAVLRLPGANPMIIHRPSTTTWTATKLKSIPVIPTSVLHSPDANRFISKQRKLQ